MRAGLVLALALCAVPAWAEIVSADFALPTDRYDHGVLGDGLEWGALDISWRECAECALQTRRFTLPETHVFEDVEARVADADGDGAPEVIVVETDMARGAALAIYDQDGRRAGTRPVGQTHRWLAPVGVADLDKDGQPEIAYVDRPHLKRDLVIVRFDGRRLTEVARIPGLTNHRIGDDHITGGIRDCGAGAEIIVASPDWTRAMRVVRGAAPQDVGPILAMADILACRG